MAASDLSPPSATCFAAMAVLAQLSAGRERLFKKRSLWAMAWGWLNTLRTSESCAPGRPSRFWRTGRSYTAVTKMSRWA